MATHPKSVNSEGVLLLGGKLRSTESSANGDTTLDSNEVSISSSTKEHQVDLCQPEHRVSRSKGSVR